MEAMARAPTTVAAAPDGPTRGGDQLSAYGDLRRRRDRRRRIFRGAVGIGTVLILWQVMAVAYDLEQILPPPLTVARTIFYTLSLNYQQPWLYGPNI
jgi:hypothetical protein